jgi:hypothetical protein
MPFTISTPTLFNQERQPASLAKLLIFAVNFAHKAATALLLGYYTYVEQSFTQASSDCDDSPKGTVSAG